MSTAPKTLIEAIRYFSDEDVTFNYVRKMRWPDGPVCPACGSKKYSFLSTRRMFKCSGCKKQYSVKVGTIFEDSPIKLDKWMCAMWMLANAKNGISSYEIHRSLGVTQKTAWFMLHRIRFAMRAGSLEKLVDHVEVDETYIGGKARNMHAHVRAQKITSRGTKDKTIVVGLLERGGEIRMHVTQTSKKKELHGLVALNVLRGSNVYTDALKSYDGLDNWYAHQVVDHAVCYVKDNVHTNGLENFWSLLKRTMLGTYVSVEPFHLFRYLDEYSFRFNERRADDAHRFETVVSRIMNKRLTYAKLTGKEMAAGI